MSELSDVSFLVASCGSRANSSAMRGPGIAIALAIIAVIAMANMGIALWAVILIAAILAVTVGSFFSE
jgi:hypothetical protein